MKVCIVGASGKLGQYMVTQSNGACFLSRVGATTALGARLEAQSRHDATTSVPIAELGPPVVFHSIFWGRHRVNAWRRWLR